MLFSNFESMLSCVYTSTEKSSEFQLITLVMQSTAKSLASRSWEPDKTRVSTFVSYPLMMTMSHTLVRQNT